MDQPTPITKAILLAEILKAWADLNSYLDRLTETQMTTILDAHGWSVKDHLTHLAAWERSVVFFLQGKPRLDGLGIANALYGSGSIDVMNAAIQKQHSDTPFSQAMAQLNDVHAELMSLIGTLSDSDLNKPLRHFLPEAPADDRRLAAQIISDNTDNHFKEHLAWIRTLVPLAQ